MPCLWLLGVGPGDPRLLTLQARECLQQADLIYHAGPGDLLGRALAGVQPFLHPSQEVRCLYRLSMSAMAAQGLTAYEPAADQIAAACRAGRRVAFLTEGDPTLYSTAGALAEVLSQKHPDISCIWVPGVSSLTAAAARAGWCLARHAEMIRVVPGAYHAAHLPQLLAEESCLCFLKPAPVLPLLCRLLEAQPQTWEAVYIEEATTPGEWQTRDLRQALGRECYFSLVLLRRTSAPPSSRTRSPASSTAEAAPSALSPSAPAAGKVWVVGLGPGADDFLTVQAQRVLHQVTDLVGYEGYLERLKQLQLTATCHPFPLGAERERARQALLLARQGRWVALVSSGDAGVYGMASPLLEEAAAFPEVAVEVVPGVTAATAAAALLGAPLGQDFVCLSLSDLLVPWPVIERRLEAAGQGDFVLALYNPASRQRTWQLARARDVLLRYRRPETPVGIVTAAGREHCQVRCTTLGELTGEGIDMETLLLVGNSQTRRQGAYLVTPRAYVPASDRPPAQATSLAMPLPPRPQEPGGDILAASFARIEQELGPCALPPWAFAVVRRMIHATADFDFAHLLRYHSDFLEAARQVVRDRLPIVVDTEMVWHGIRAAAARAGLPLVCYLRDPQAQEASGVSRTAAGIRLAAQRHSRPLVVVGNAPTALSEALRLVEEAGWRPAALIGMPVGFVGVEEAKRRLQEQTQVPYLTCIGRKGGSAVAAAAVNALIEWFRGAAAAEE